MMPVTYEFDESNNFSSTFGLKKMRKAAKSFSQSINVVFWKCGLTRCL